MLLLTSSFHIAEANDAIILQYTHNETYIRNRIQEIKALPENGNSYWYSTDAALEERDPHAHWLLNRMVPMGMMVKSADDAWAWAIAMGSCIDQYNARLGRKIGSSTQAMLAIEELIDIYVGGNQRKMNLASSITLAMDYYKTINTYYEFLDYVSKYSVEDRRIQTLYYQEYKAWYNLHHAAEELLKKYTYAGAVYSMSTTEKNEIISSWLRNRSAMLEHERTHYNTFGWKSFKSDKRVVAAEEFSTLFNHFRNISVNEIIAHYLKEYGGDEDYTKERLSKAFNAKNILQAVDTYEKSLIAWRKIREQIAAILDKEMQISFRETTKQMHTQLYEDLTMLKQLKF